MGFLVLTITAERVELARLHMPRSGENILVLAAAALTLAMLTAVFWPDVAIRAAALVILAFTIWLVRHDVAGKFIRGAGLPRFSAAALLGGYFWLGVAACIWLVGGYQYEGYVYDAVVHSVMLGFAMSMIMAHAPIILPAVLPPAPLPLRDVGAVGAAPLRSGDLACRRPACLSLPGISMLNAAAVLLFSPRCHSLLVLATVLNPNVPRPLRPRKVVRYEYPWHVVHA